jgi:hypothetical protein
VLQSPHHAPEFSFCLLAWRTGDEADDARHDGMLSGGLWAVGFGLFTAYSAYQFVAAGSSDPAGKRRSSNCAEMKAGVEKTRPHGVVDWPGLPRP